MNDSVAYFITAVSKEDCEYSSHLKCSTQSPLQPRSFHSKGNNNLQSHLCFAQKLILVGNRHFTLPSVYFVRAGEFTMEYSKGNHSSHAGAEAFSI